MLNLKIGLRVFFWYSYLSNYHGSQKICHGRNIGDGVWLRVLLDTNVTEYPALIHIFIPSVESKAEEQWCSHFRMLFHITPVIPLEPIATNIARFRLAICRWSTATSVHDMWLNQRKWLLYASFIYCFKFQCIYASCFRVVMYQYFFFVYSCSKWNAASLSFLRKSIIYI